tara:strand:- start:383 stop:631 length:249 start_codon:yes stop_codon:yes gene_type:complete
VPDELFAFISKGIPQYETSEISTPITRFKAPRKIFEIKSMLLFLKVENNSGLHLSLSSSSGSYILYRIAKIRAPSVKTKNDI